MALYKRYKDEGKTFVPKIEAILAAGGSEDPTKVLSSVGIDMASADFWRGSFEILESWMEQLKQL
jgi:oligoendopeptidase F